jgi:hypothetical protein
MAIRVGEYKLVRYDTNADTRTGDRNQPVTAAKLYNLASDIGETQDLAAAMPEKVQQLQAQWDAWNATLVAPLWGGGRAESGKSQASTKKNQRNKRKNAGFGARFRSAGYDE